MSESILERTPHALRTSVPARCRAATDPLGNTAEVEANLPDEPRTETGLTARQVLHRTRDRLRQQVAERPAVSLNWWTALPSGHFHVFAFDILSITSAAATATLDVLGRRYDCSKEERQKLHNVFTRMCAFECDVYATLYTAYLAHDARMQRDMLAKNFEDGIAATIAVATGEGDALYRQAMAARRRSAACWARRAKWLPLPSSLRSRCAKPRRPPRG